MTETTPDVAFAEWAIVDVMGHQRYVGRVTEQVVAGQGFIRVDVPETPKAKAWTKLIGTGSIYAITPVSEEIARAIAIKREAVPISRYELPESLRTARIGVAADEDADDYDDEPDYH